MKMKLSPRPKLKTNLKTNLTVAAWALGIASAVTGVVFLYFNLGTFETAFAAGSSYTSTKTGSWSTNSTWSGGTAPPSTNINGDVITINNNHVINASGLDAKNNAVITIRSNATLVVTGDLVVDNNLILNNSGNLVITGNLITKNGAAITINNGGGIAKISGAATFAQNAVVRVNGILNVGGAVSFGSNAVFSGTGTVTAAAGCNSWAGPGTCSTGSLPVKLVAFNAENNNGSVRLTWKTASEENNDYFTIERTTDGSAYEFISKVSGNGTTLNSSAYEYVDATPLEGKSYYRLSQTDFDGKKEIFNNVTVDVALTSASFKIYPNPLVGNTLNISISKPEEGSIEIRDVKGNQIISKSTGRDDDNFQITLNESVQPGFYFVSYKTASAVKVERFVKQ
jgi:hypothetical protein